MRPIQSSRALQQRTNGAAATRHLARVLRPDDSVSQPGKESCQTVYPDRLGWRAATALQVIASTYIDPQLDMETVAQLAGVTKCHLCRLFKQQLKMGFPEYLRRFRACHAEVMLRETVFSIKEIAAGVGFAHVAQLDRAFRSVYGYTPSDYRKQFHAPALD